MFELAEYVMQRPEDLTLNMTYSTHRGWHIKLQYKGYDMPLIDVKHKDKQQAFETAYIKIKKYFERQEQQ